MRSRFSSLLICLVLLFLFGRGSGEFGQPTDVRRTIHLVLAIAVVGIVFRGSPYAPCTCDNGGSCGEPRASYRAAP